VTAVTVSWALSWPSLADRVNDSSNGDPKMKLAIIALVLGVIGLAQVKLPEGHWYSDCTDVNSCFVGP
jgi:hypothetical protein